MNKKSFLISLFNQILLLTFISFIQVEAKAQGDLLITPRRVVFEGSKRSMDLSLSNTGKDTAVYAISLVQIRMIENGNFETITEPDPGQLFADKNIRYFPRTVTLGPEETQVVKVQLTRVNELTAGEYRSHFYFRAIQKPQPLGQKDAAADSNTISVVLRPVFGITIPVIIRVGETSAQVTMSDLSFKMEDSVPNLSMVFNRTGNKSVYGDLQVFHVSPQGKTTNVGTVNGIAIYTPNIKRVFQLNLDNVADFSAGTIKAVFSASTDVKPEKYAEAELSLR